MKRLLFSAVMLAGFLAPLARAEDTLYMKLLHTLPLYGHRNWIVVADAAYPAQTSPGVETIHVNERQLEAIKTVLTELGKTQHVKPIIHLDAELKALDDKLAPGVEAYRKNLMTLLEGQRIEQELHENIIKKLDDAGKTFRVLIIKTDSALPYTSVFFQLDCGYWTQEKEKQLRKSMAK